jgi:hypothetical protein
VEVVVQDGEDETKVSGRWRLGRQQLLRSLLDMEVAIVDLVVERDDLVGELDVAGGERVERAAERAEDEVALLLEGGAELVKGILELDSHPNLPVT